jgi:hypothetical protein
MKHAYIHCRIVLFYENMYGCKEVQLLWHLCNNIALTPEVAKRKLDGTNPFIQRCYVTVANQFMEQSWESDACSSLKESNHLLWNQHSIASLVYACLWVLSRRKSEHFKTLCSIIRYIFSIILYLPVLPMNFCIFFRLFYACVVSSPSYFSYLILFS